MIKTNYRITEKDKIVVMTGAGISAESGLKTFRDENGLCKNHAIEEVACYSAFIEQPEFVWEFYGIRFKQLKEAKPNPAHYALVKMEEQLGDRINLVTKNVDGLHQIAGNLQRPMNYSLINEFHKGKAGEILPALTDLLLGEN